MVDRVYFVIHSALLRLYYIFDRGCSSFHWFDPRGRDRRAWFEVLSLSSLWPISHRLLNYLLLTTFECHLHCFYHRFLFLCYQCATINICWLLTSKSTPMLDRYLLHKWFLSSDRLLDSWWGSLCSFLFHHCFDLSLHLCHCFLHLLSNLGLYFWIYNSLNSCFKIIWQVIVLIFDFCFLVNPHLYWVIIMFLFKTLNVIIISIHFVVHFRFTK